MDLYSSNGREPGSAQSLLVDPRFIAALIKFVKLQFLSLAAIIDAAEGLSRLAISLIPLFLLSFCSCRCLRLCAP
jgi:hypothetical protein